MLARAPPGVLQSLRRGGEILAQELLPRCAAGPWIHVTRGGPGWVGQD